MTLEEGGRRAEEPLSRLQVAAHAGFLKTLAKQVAAVHRGPVNSSAEESPTLSWKFYRCLISSAANVRLLYARVPEAPGQIHLRYICIYDSCDRIRETRESSYIRFHTG